MPTRVTSRVLAILMLLPAVAAAGPGPDERWCFAVAGESLCADSQPGCEARRAVVLEQIGELVRDPDRRQAAEARASPCAAVGATIAVAPADLAPDDVAPAESDRRDPAVAALWSWIPTAAGGLLVATALGPQKPSSGATALLVLGLGAIAVGPTLGHLYAEDTGDHGWLVLRLCGLALIGYAALGCHDVGCGALTGTPGVAALAVGAIGDAMTASAAAEAYDREHHLDVGLVPIETARGLAAAVALVGRF